MSEGASNGADDPRELARRLAEQAKAKAAAMREDPRELAKRLAEQAKARSQAEDPRALAKRLAEQAKAQQPKPAAPTPVPSAGPPPRRPLAARANKRPMSAMEAFRLAAEAEKQEEERAAQAEREAAAREAEAQAQAAAAARAAEEEARRAAEAAALQAAEQERLAQEAAQQAAPEVPSAAPSEPPIVKGMDPSELIAIKLRDVTVLGVTTVVDRAVFRALWKAHRARARADGQIALLVTADVLLDAADRVPAGALHALHIESDGSPYAAWVDGDRQVILGMTQTPDIFLAGL